MLNSGAILVLTTGEKDWWWSMQEVIPAMENLWLHIGLLQERAVYILRVPLSLDEESLVSSLVPNLSHIVLLAATPKTVETALRLRRHCECIAPFTVYIFGDSTEGFHAFGELVDVLTEQDLLVVSCDAEKLATQECFPSADVRVMPIPLADGMSVRIDPHREPSRSIRLTYVGRVSEQKNLHTLLLSLWILRFFYACSSNIVLDVYGEQDDLGSPNMGLTFPNYGDFLRNLCRSLHVDDIVYWRGFKQRRWLLDHVHSRRHVLVTPSLHSDENFGASVLASLLTGNQVVATAWGGHLEYRELFSSLMTLVPVRRSTLGPVIDPVVLADAIRTAIGESSSARVEDPFLVVERAHYSIVSVAARTAQFLSRPERSKTLLRKSRIQQHLNERRAAFGGKRRIFDGYEDPSATTFFVAYGMGEELSFDAGCRYFLVPWVHYEGDELCVDDPHRGRRRYGLAGGEGPTSHIMECPSMSVSIVSDGAAQELAKAGYIFPLPRMNGGLR